MRKKIYLLFILSLSLWGCDMIQYHPYDGRISGETGINNKNIKRIEEACANKKEIKFVLIGDTQRDYDDTKDFVKHLNQKNDIDFVIHGGDISDFGVTKEFIWMRDIMNGLTVPYVVLLGNHDCLANGEQIHRKIFGEPNFTFMAGNIRFVCLNTNALEYDYSRPVPDFTFIENVQLLENPKHEKTVFAMHVRPYNEQFNNNVAKVFQHTIKDFTNLQFCVNAHDHNLSVEDLFNDGVMYYGCASINKRSYLQFTIKNDDTYSYEEVKY